MRETMSRADRTRRQAYLKEFVPAMVAYAVVLSAVLAAVDPDARFAWAWMLVPMLPCLWVIRAVARDLGRADEYSRLVQLEAMAVGFGVAMAASLTMMFLAAGGVSTRTAGVIPFCAGMFAWGLAAYALKRRDA